VDSESSDKQQISVVSLNTFYLFHGESLHYGSTSEVGFNCGLKI